MFNLYELWILSLWELKNNKYEMLLNKEKRKEYMKEYREQNKEKIKEKRKEYREQNKEKIKEKRKEYYEQNKEKMKEYKKEHYEQNKEKMKEYMKEYYEQNKEKIKENKKEYNEQNKEKRKEYIKKRCEVDELFRLKRIIRKMIGGSFKRKSFKKISKTELILGCSFQSFKIYLENQFEPWMNWDNYGLYNGELNYGWDIDHIIGLKKARSFKDIIKLNHYTNLQPLCSKKNRDIKK